AEAEELVATAETHGRILMAGHLLLYQPAIEKVGSLMAEGAIGRIFTIHLDRMKLGRARSVENVLWSFGVHDIAVLLHLVGEIPTEVSASGHSGLNAGVEDDVYLHLSFPGGIRAHLHDSWLWPVDRRCLTVVGSEGMIVYDEKVQTVTLHRKRIDPATLAQTDEGEEIVFDGAPQPLANEMRHFLDCIARRETPKSDGRSAVEVIRVLERASRTI
ncbi:MAG: Gfo/Idh/MocA family oxidoreductase, partial [Verrucomicrobiae bacterium]|nr:Gfo/Idh/MocA family oxidoreductase [Verrucomicrobiae bacterium]